MLAEKYGDATREAFEAAVQKAIAERSVPQRIIQIKGKQNRAPNEEYLPFVQDFVRNSPLGSAWDDVGDLQNAGMLRFGQDTDWQTRNGKWRIPRGFYTEQDLRSMAQQANLSADDIEAFFAQQSNARRFEAGGSVRAEDWKAAYNAGVNDGWKADYNLSLQETA